MLYEPAVRRLTRLLGAAALAGFLAAGSAAQADDSSTATLSPQALYTLGRNLEHGIGQPRDPAAALAWYRRTAEQGHARAQFEVGDALRYGSGVAPDLPAAIGWLARAADGGETLAAIALGDLFEQGTELPRDPARAARHYRAAAAGGNAYAQSALATLYDRGDGVAADPVEAWSLHELAWRGGLCTRPQDRERLWAGLSDEARDAARRRVADLAGRGYLGPRAGLDAHSGTHPSALDALGDNIALGLLGVAALAQIATLVWLWRRDRRVIS